jgi:hypothetical protein
MLKRMLGLLVLVIFTGCLQFGSEIVTTQPNQEQIQRCKREMFISPGVNIQPEGFKLDASGFVAKTNDISQVFLKQHVDTTLFKPGFNFDWQENISWWDVSKVNLTGGNVDIPTRGMRVGYKHNNDDTLTVYVLWHEI